MAVVIDSTIGGTSSNSYNSLVEIKQYFEERPYTDDVLALSDDDLSVLAIYATRMIDNLLIPNGTIADDDQALNFPREDLTDINGREIDSDVIPTGIKYAQCEQIIALNESDITKELSILNQGFKSARVDVLSIELDKLNAPDQMSKQTVNFLRPYGTLVPGVITGGLSNVYVDKM